MNATKLKYYLKKPEYIRSLIYSKRFYGDHLTMQHSLVYVTIAASIDWMRFHLDAFKSQTFWIKARGPR
jgi:stress-induced morphogen